MDSPTLFRTPITSPVLLPSKSGWDNGHLYRCSFQIIDDGTGYLYTIGIQRKDPMVNGTWVILKVLLDHFTGKKTVMYHIKWTVFIYHLIPFPLK